MPPEDRIISWIKQPFVDQPGDFQFFIQAFAVILNIWKARCAKIFDERSLSHPTKLPPMQTKRSISGRITCSDILTQVENFMGSQACDTARMLGVSSDGVDKGLKNSMLLIKRRWLADVARKAKADVAGKFKNEGS